MQLIDPVTRKEFLRVGLLALSSLALPRSFSAPSTELSLIEKLQAAPDIQEASRLLNAHQAPLIKSGMPGFSREDERNIQKILLNKMVPFFKELGVTTTFDEVENKLPVLNERIIKNNLLFLP